MQRFLHHLLKSFPFIRIVSQGLKLKVNRKGMEREKKKDKKSLKIFKQVHEFGNFFLLVVGQLPCLLDSLALIEVNPVLVFFVLSLLEGFGQLEVDGFRNEDGFH
jgi:hypothetical protein